MSTGKLEDGKAGAPDRPVDTPVDAFAAPLLGTHRLLDLGQGQRTPPTEAMPVATSAPSALEEENFSIFEFGR